MGNNSKKRSVVGRYLSHATCIHAHHAVAPMNSSRFSQALPTSCLLRAWIPLAPRRRCRFAVLAFWNSSPTETRASETCTFQIVHLKIKKCLPGLGGGEEGRERSEGVKTRASAQHEHVRLQSNFRLEFVAVFHTAFGVFGVFFLARSLLSLSLSLSPLISPPPRVPINELSTKCVSPGIRATHTT